MKKVKICGIPYKIIEVPVIDEDEEGITQGKILYSQGKILIKKDLPKKLKKQVLYHEIIHGMLVLLGYTQQSADEVFVQSLTTAIFQIFDLKER